MSKSILSAAILATAGLSLSVTGAQAQDWTGFYAGLTGTAATGTNQIEGEFNDFFGDNGQTIEDFPSTILRTEISAFEGMIEQAVDLDGGMFGAQVGYMFEAGGIIYGGELSYRTGDVSYSGVVNGGGDGLVHGGGQEYQSSMVEVDLEVQNMVSLRAILGTAVAPRTMVFTSLGVVSAQTETTFGFSEGRPRFARPALREGNRLVGSDENTRTGFSIGFGVSQALSDRLFLTGEYTYTDLGTARYRGGDEWSGPFIDIEQDISFSALTVGLNLRF
jgi:opacity protein-like surface antigen